MHARAIVMTALLLAALDGAGCGSTDAKAVVGASTVQRSTTPLPRVTEADYDPANFSDTSIEIDNQWFPLAPGTQFVYEGQWNRGTGIVPHQVIFTVTDLTKVVDGVNTVVLLDRDETNGALAEVEITFHAQDSDGNIWNMGEYPEEYENGQFAGAPSTWLAGVQRATAGIIMRGDPRLGTPSYMQGFAPLVEFRDRARVAKTGGSACVPTGCYDDLLVIDEWSPLAPDDGHALKLFARGVGAVRVDPAGGQEDESLVLTAMRTLDAAARSEANAQASRLDELAYRVAAPVYGESEPAKQRRPKRGA